MDFDHLTPLLQVFDMPASLAFYRDVLGFAVVMQSGPSAPESDWLMLRRGQSTLMLNTAYERDQRPPSPDASRRRWHGDTALFFGCASADEVYAFLQSKGWTAKPPLNTSYGMRQVYTTDPDGYELCFQHPVAVPAGSDRGA